MIFLRICGFDSTKLAEGRQKFKRQNVKGWKSYGYRPFSTLSLFYEFTR
jgi:hypothetical protein